jgi:hypothetical protein
MLNVGWLRGWGCVCSKHTSVVYRAARKRTDVYRRNQMFWRTVTGQWILRSGLPQYEIIQDTSLLISTVSSNTSSTVTFFLHAAVKLALSCRRSKHDCEVAVFKPLSQCQNNKKKSYHSLQTSSGPQVSLKGRRKSSAEAASTDGKCHMFPIKFQLDLFEILYSKRLNTPTLICYV